MRAPEKLDAHNTLRTFIALELGPDIKQALAAYLQPLRKMATGISWVKTENLHLTLKFLGDTPVAQIPEIAAALGEICARSAPVHIKISGSGVFPDEKKPRVLWLGLQTENDRLSKLAGEIDAACVQFGFGAERRPFAPHLTIGRIRSGTAENVIAAMREHRFPGAGAAFNECIFMKSALHPAGSLYTPLHKFFMTGKRTP